MLAFNPTNFKLDYPEFASITDAKLTNLFNYNAKSFYQWAIQRYSDGLYKGTVMKTNSIIGRV